MSTYVKYIEMDMIDDPVAYCTDNLKGVYYTEAPANDLVYGTGILESCTWNPYPGYKYKTYNYNTHASGGCTYNETISCEACEGAGGVWDAE